MKPALGPRTKRKIRKILKSKWTKTVIFSLMVFFVLFTLGFLIPMLIMVILDGAIGTILLLKASLIINAIVYPLYFKQCLEIVEKRETNRRAKKRRHEKATQESGL